MRSTLGTLTALALAGMLQAVASPAQNPFQAATDALKKALQQAQQQDRPQGQHQATQSTGAGVPSDPQAASSDDCCSADAQKKYVAAASSLDMVGIKLGMTLEQTVAAMKAYNPAMQVEVLNGRLEHPTARSGSYVRTPLFVSGHTARAPGSVYETITAEFTSPPSRAVVFVVQRVVEMPPAQAVRASNLVGNFTKKYGPSNFQSTRGMAWVYDQNGKLLPRVDPRQDHCMGATTELPVGSGDPSRDNYKEINLANSALNPGDGLSVAPDCLEVNWVTVIPLGSIAPDQSVTRLIMFMASGPLWYSGRKVTHDWLQGEADEARKKADDAAAHQTGPKL